MAEVRGQSRRDLGITALVLGFFAAAWFGWGGGGAPDGWQPFLTAGSVVGLAVAVAGAVVGFTSRTASTLSRDRAASRRYGIIVGIEFGAIALGGVVLGLAGAAEYVAAWVCLVVGVHFFPLAPVLRDPLLVPLGALVCAVAVVATVVGLTTSVAASFVAGLGAGVLLAVYAAVALVRGLRS